MPYDNIISRTDAGGVIPEDRAAQIIEMLPEQSAALQLFMRAPNMSSSQARLLVTAALPQAYFVSGDTGLKQTSEKNWKSRYLIAEELACIVPIPEAVLDDAAYDIWGNTRPSMVEAIGRAIDNAIFFEVNKPSTWPTGLVPGAVAAGNTYTRGTNNQAAGGVAEDFNQLFGTVETDGFDVNGVVGNRSLKARLRGARATTGEPISNVNADTVYGEQIAYLARGMWPSGSGVAEAIAGDWSQGIIAIRQDMTWKLLDQAALFDDNGALIFNLPQQDMVALRLVFRLAFAVSNAVTWDQPVEANRYPWGVMLTP